MKTVLKGCTLLIVLITLATGCNPEPKTADGFPASELSVCTWCGDYELETPGTKHTTIGVKMRICGISEKWEDGCPIRTDLGDGSKWKKASPTNCSCD